MRDSEEKRARDDFYAGRLRSVTESLAYRAERDSLEKSHRMNLPTEGSTAGILILLAVVTLVGFVASMPALAGVAALTGIAFYAVNKRSPLLAKAIVSLGVIAAICFAVFSMLENRWQAKQQHEMADEAIGAIRSSVAYKKATNNAPPTERPIMFLQKQLIELDGYLSSLDGSASSSLTDRSSGGSMDDLKLQVSWLCHNHDMYLRPSEANVRGRLDDICGSLSANSLTPEDINSLTVWVVDDNIFQKQHVESREAGGL